MRWVVGDIHGMARPLKALIAAVRDRDPIAQFLFVGDYVNRGPDTRGVIDFLLALSEESPDIARFARGNHDDVFDLIVNDQCYCDEPDHPVRGFSWFMQFGLANTLESYGVAAADMLRVERRPDAAALKKLLEPIPQSHRDFIRRLRPVLEDRDCFVIHANWNIAETTDFPPIAQRLGVDRGLRRSILWNRFSDSDLLAPKRWERTGFFGHTPVPNYAASNGLPLPLVGPSIVLLDTGAALGRDGRLTAVCVETRQYLQSDIDGAVGPIGTLEMR